MIAVSGLDKKANFLNLVILPFLVMFIYTTMIASDFYVSEAIFTVKENSNNSNGLDLGLLSIGNASGIEDERLMKEYLKTSDILTFLDKTVDYRAHFQDSGSDWFSALSSNATQEEYLEYYRNRIDVYLDETSGLLYVEVQAFDGEYARQLLEVMLQQVEDVLNAMSHRLAMTQYQFVEKQLVKSQESLRVAKQNLQAFQNKYQMFSPEQKGKSLTAIMDALEGELSQERAKLKQILGAQKAGSTEVVIVKERIRALAEQIEDEKARLVGQGDEGLNDLVLEYTNLQLELEFTKNAYASTLAALELSRAETSKNIKHLVVVSKPSTPEEAKYPDRSYILITALVVLLMLFGIVRMTISTIREHQD